MTDDRDDAPNNQADQQSDKELDTPELEADEADEVETKEAAKPDQSDEDDQGEDAAEEFELEIDGKKLTLPKWAEGAVLLQRDYTKKTQEVAKEREIVERAKAELDDSRKTVEQVAELQKNHSALFARVVTLDGLVRSLKSQDLTKLGDEEAGQHARQILLLDQQLAQATTALQDAEHKRGLAAETEFRRKSEEAWRACEKLIPNWSEKTRDRILSYGVSLGYKPEQLARLQDPVAYAALNKARMWDALMAKNQRAARSPETTEQKPVTRVRPKGRVPSGPADSDDTATWMKRRQAQLAQG